MATAMLVVMILHNLDLWHMLSESLKGTQQHYNPIVYG